MNESLSRRWRFLNRGAWLDVGAVPLGKVHETVPSSAGKTQRIRWPGKAFLKVLVVGFLAFGLFAVGLGCMQNGINDAGPPAPRCPMGEHPGGEACVPEGECSNGYSLDSASGSCSTWTSNDGLFPSRTVGKFALLVDGRVLASGGRFGSEGNFRGTNSVFSPAGTWTSVENDHRPSVENTLTFFLDRVLLIGGRSGIGGTAEDLVEAYSPPTNTWLSIGSLNTARIGHQTVVVGDTLLVLGGRNFGSFRSGVEKLVGDEFVLVPAELNDPRALFTSVAISNDEILVIGGYSGGGTLASVEYHRLESATFERRAPMTLPRSSHTATLLQDGRIVVIGGNAWELEFEQLAFVEIYDVASDSWEGLSRLVVPRQNHAATLLADGRILITGGFDADNLPTSIVELLNPQTGEITLGPPLPEARARQPALRLLDDSVLVGQGSATTNNRGATRSVDRFIVAQ